jgi:hypothetical protein
MTRIAITVEAYEVIAAPPFGIVARVPTGGSISPGSAQHAARGKGPYVFPGGRPRQPLSVMAMPRLGDEAVDDSFVTALADRDDRLVRPNA